MFQFGSAEADRAFAMDFTILAVIAGAVFFALIWLGGILARMEAAERKVRIMRRTPEDIRFRRFKTEDRGQRTEDRGQKTEDRRQRTED